MTDPYQSLLAHYAVQPHRLSPETIHEVKRRLIDSLGVMCAAIHDDSPTAARNYAAQFKTKSGAAVFGAKFKTTPEIAGFVNGVHVRYLDYNDTYLSLEPLHPSDVIPPLLALAESVDASGKQLIGAIAVAYEIGMNLCDAASLRKHGWDHVNYIGLAAAVGASRLLKLNAAQTGHALSIALVPHAAMRQTRSGELSMWKGAAAANSARNGLFGALLAAQGFTGPFEMFTGKMGVFVQLFEGEVFREEALQTMQRGEAPRRICDSYIKAYPVEYHAQSAVDVAKALYEEIGDWRRIEKIEIETFKASYEIIAGDPEKQKPTTRETADHSLQYITCVGLMDGAVRRESFALKKIRSQAVRELLAKTTVKENDRLTALYPESIPVVVTVHLRDGNTVSREARYPRGHVGNKMPDDELVKKFELNRAGTLSSPQAKTMLNGCWKLDSLKSVRGLTQCFPNRDHARC
ncbi:MAG: MmgE/PrpD family protein [Chloroflexi bacterium]|nr:MmgE/PrpD family protein [Chloroflexota bacterium]